MALPYEGDSEAGRTAAEYELASGTAEVQPLNINPRTSRSNIQQEGRDEIDDEDEQEPPKSLYHRICPGFITRIPSIILITLMIVLVLFVVCSIPLVFALTYSDSAAQIAQNGNTSALPPPDEVWLENSTEVDVSPSDDENATFSLLLAHLLPKNVSLCEGRGFSCVNFPSISIGLNSVCDGVADCPDGSDEARCGECKTSFSCPSSPSNSSSSNSTSESFFTCLRADALCDGVLHCSDQSDESLCSKKTCSSSEFQCPESDMCLPQSFLCDGESHCRGGADELNCDGKCSNGSKWCDSSKTCLPKWKLCDGKADCKDASDEEGCSCNECAGKGKMLCKSSSSDNDGFCLQSAKVCDGVQDCSSGQDEDGCPGELKAPSSVEMVKCKDGKEYSKMYACIGLIPACRGACEKCDEKFAFDCGNNDCILKSKRCDGVQDCENGSDEENCECPSSESYECKTPLKDGKKKKCIEKSQMCDGFLDCPGGDDEENCSKCSNENVFKCKNQEKCISPTERCDGRKHCSDGSDEEDCSAEECAVHPFPMYLCKDGKSCFRNDEVCLPYSACPAPSAEDKGFCPGIRFRFRI